MSAQAVEAPTTSRVAPDKLRHIYCMDHREHGMCGAPRNIPADSLRPIFAGPLPPHVCVVCNDLAFEPCPKCEAA